MARDISDAERRAMEALQLLEHPLIKEALDIAYTAYIKGASDCRANDDLGRFRMIEASKVVSQVKNHLETVVKVGKLEARDTKPLMGPRFSRRKL